MVIGTTKGSRVVKEGILYGSPSRGKRLDVYLPADTPTQHQNEGSRNTASPSSNGVPVIVVIPSMLGPLTITSKRRLYLQLALRLRRMGYCVIVADITYYPESRIKSSVIDLRLVLRWTAKNCQRYGGDPSKIYVLGHGLSAHLIMLTISQEAVVLSREGHLDRAYERERHMLRAKHGAEHSKEGEEEEWLKSGEVRSSAGGTRKRVVSSAHSDALDEDNEEPVRLSGRSTRRLSNGEQGWVDESEDPTHTSSSPPGMVMGSTSRFTNQTHRHQPQTATTSRKVKEAESILTSDAYRKAEDEVGNGLRHIRTRSRTSCNRRCDLTLWY